MATPTLIHDGTSTTLAMGWDTTSGYRITPGEVESDVDRQRFAATQGAFAANYGVAGRLIVIEGAVRLTNANWLVLKGQRASLLAEGGTWTFTDADGEEYKDCLVRGFALGPPISIANDADIDCRADYRIVLDQLAP